MNQWGLTATEVALVLYIGFSTIGLVFVPLIAQATGDSTATLTAWGVAVQSPPSTAAQFVMDGVTSSSLAYHSRTGSIERLGHGVYRLANFPSSPREPLIAAAAALGKDAIVSHESALQLYGVSDVAPSRLHFTVPRARRYVTAPADNVEVHTTTRPFAPGDVVQHEGFRATSLTRSIVDAARTYTGSEQIVMAVREGLRRGLLAPHQLERAMQNVPKRVRDLIEEGQST